MCVCRLVATQLCAQSLTKLSSSPIFKLKESISGKVGGEGAAYRIYCLVQEKVALCDELVTVSRLIESNRLELEPDEATFDLHPSKLRQEVTQAQVRIQSLATSLKDNEDNLRTILVSLSGERKADGTSDHSSLIEERLHRQELENRCESLGQDIDFVNSENDILRQQNIRLQNEIQRLRDELGRSQAQELDAGSFSDDDVSEADPENREAGISPSSSDYRKIRSHAERLLDWADRAVEKGRTSVEDHACESTIGSSVGTDLRPSSRRPTNAAKVDNRENQFLISNMSNVGGGADAAFSSAVPATIQCFRATPSSSPFTFPC